MTVTERIRAGEMPASLEWNRANWASYAGRVKHEPTWEGFAAAWRDVAWVRCQGFERDAEAEWAAEEHEASIAAGGAY